MTMFKKGYAFDIDRVWVPRNVKTASATKAAEELHMESQIPEDMVFSDDYVYTTVRAISARVNMNMDGFMRDELLGVTPEFIKLPIDKENLPPHNEKFGYRTFKNKWNHVDHYNQPELAEEDPRHEPRGKILHSWYIEEPLEKEVRLGRGVDPITKQAGVDSWVKLLIANDRKKFPVLCRAIEDGIVTKVSMGAEVLGSTCSVCGNFAGAPYQYCTHIRHGRGSEYMAEKSSHFVQQDIVREMDPVVAFENNHGLQFFEESWILDIQADPTAVIMELIKAEPGTSMKHIAASKTAGVRDYKQILLDLINHEAGMTVPDLEKVATVLDKSAANPNVHIEIDNIEELIQQKREESGIEETEELTEDTQNKEMDYNTPPHEQEGEFFPDYPFPCSARTEASNANPEYPIDATIDVEVCMGCMYNKSDKVGAVDCEFPEVVREGGSDPLPAGFQPPSSGQNRDSFGIRDEEGREIKEFPGITHPPGVNFDKASQLKNIETLYKLKAMLEVGRGKWVTAAEETEERQNVREDFTFQQQVRVTLPAHTDEETVSHVRQEMSKFFGGVDVDTGGMDTIITSYTNEDVSAALTFVNGLTEQIDGAHAEVEDVGSDEHYVEISIASNTVGGNKVQGRTFIVDSIRQLMEGEFGNAEVKDTSGGWFDDDKEHLDDKTRIKSVINDTSGLEDAKLFIQDLASQLEGSMDQYAVEYHIDGRPHYTKPLD